MYRRCILLIKYIDQVIFSKKLKAKMCESGEVGGGGGVFLKKSGMKRGWSFRKQQDREHFLNHGPSNGSLTNQSIENSCYVDLKVFLCNHFLTFLLNLSFRICARKRYNQYDIKFWSTTSSCSRCTSTCARAQWRGMRQIFIQN